VVTQDSRDNGNKHVCFWGGGDGGGWFRKGLSSAANFASSRL